MAVRSAAVAVLLKAKLVALAAALAQQALAAAQVHRFLAVLELPVKATTAVQTTISPTLTMVAVAVAVQAAQAAQQAALQAALAAQQPTAQSMVLALFVHGVVLAVVSAAWAAAHQEVKVLAKVLLLVQTQAAVATASQKPDSHLLHPAMVVLASSLFVMLAHSAAQVARSRLRAATRSTPSPAQAHS